MVRYTARDIFVCLFFFIRLNGVDSIARFITLIAILCRFCFSVSTCTRNVTISSSCGTCSVHLWRVGRDTKMIAGAIARGSFYVGNLLLKVSSNSSEYGFLSASIFFINFRMFLERFYLGWLHMWLQMIFVKFVLFWKKT